MNKASHFTDLLVEGASPSTIGSSPPLNLIQFLSSNFNSSRYPAPLQLKKKREVFFGCEKSGFRYMGFEQHIPDLQAIDDPKGLVLDSKNQLLYVSSSIKRHVICLDLKTTGKETISSSTNAYGALSATRPRTAYEEHKEEQAKRLLHVLKNMQGDVFYTVYASGMCLDSKGNLYVGSAADGIKFAGSGGIFKFEAPVQQFNKITKLKSKSTGAEISTSVNMMTMDSKDNLFFVESSNNMMMVFCSENEELYAVAGSAANKKLFPHYKGKYLVYDQFVNPYGIAVNPVDESLFFITDMFAHTILKVDLRANTIAVVAGQHGIRDENGYVEGIGTDVLFFYPAGIAIHGTKLYISQREWHRPLRTMDIFTNKVSMLRLSNVLHDDQPPTTNVAIDNSNNCVYVTCWHAVNKIM